MGEIRFEFDWEDPQGARGPELRATWARLSIVVDGAAVTRLDDHHLDAVRSYVWMPLYPLAEWVAANWWSLLFETRSTAPRPGFESRHNLRFAGEGFVLPDLEILPLGRHVQLSWFRSAREDWPGEFLATGTSLVEREALEAEMQRLVEAVLQRLEDREVQGTWLAEEWRRLQSLEPEEAEFCRTAAALGFDPFGMERDRSEEILRVHEELLSLRGIDASEAWEFLQAADADHLARQLRLLREAHERVISHVHAANGLGRFRLSAPRADLPPWSQGYLWARELRDQLNLQDRRFTDFDDLLGTLSRERPAIVEVEGAHLFDALAVRGEGDRLSVGLPESKRRPEARSFAFCRGIGDLLANGRPGTDFETRLVTSGQTERQKRNRAFAAEFLAPARLLRTEIPGPVIQAEEIERLAAGFGVSNLVIEHQLENHHLVQRTLR